MLIWLVPISKRFSRSILDYWPMVLRSDFSITIVLISSALKWKDSYFCLFIVDTLTSCFFFLFVVSYFYVFWFLLYIAAYISCFVLRAWEWRWIVWKAYWRRDLFKKLTSWEVIENIDSIVLNLDVLSVDCVKMLLAIAYWC